MRFLPHTKEDRESMLKEIGVSSIDDLYCHVPKECRMDGLLDLPSHQGEIEIENWFNQVASKNVAANSGPFFLGAGCYNHHIPATVDHIIQRSEFLTAYTPYQPEISQGTLTVIFEFQSMLARLTGMEIANASMYDGATSVTEAALMAKRITKRPNVHIYGELNPQYKEVLHSYLHNLDGEVFESDPDEKAACVIVQTPDFHGNIHQLEALRKKCDEAGALFIVAVTEIVSLGLLPPPSCADIVAGEAQSIGVAMQFGGPHLGFFACKQKYVRQMPGRLCGQTVDADGKRSFVLTLNTREQHIRREKATSNICTNQGLCATAFTIHLSLLGEEGFKQLSAINHEKACELADILSSIKGVEIENETFFNEFVIKLPKDATEIVKTLAEKGIVAGWALEDNRLLVAATEMTSSEDMQVFKSSLEEII